MQERDEIPALKKEKSGNRTRVAGNNAEDAQRRRGGLKGKEEVGSACGTYR